MAWECLQISWWQFQGAMHNDSQSLNANMYANFCQIHVGNAVAICLGEKSLRKQVIISGQ